MNVAQFSSQALYPKLAPGPHSSSQGSVSSHQRARLYGAMIELVAARGYEASTVAQLCTLAGVSKRTLYERFPGGKQQCFLATYDIIAHRGETRILACEQCGLEVLERADPLARLRTMVEAFANEVAAYPNAARLALVEAAGAGPAALARTQRTTRRAERVIAWSLRNGSKGPAPSPVLVKAIVAEGAELVRARLLDGRVSGLARELSDFCATAAAPLAAPPAGPIRGCTQVSAK
ncbi:MAG TPA: TetR/AcrR family transcriptional regulator [Solirubrobacteraceae bacterium]